MTAPKTFRVASYLGSLAIKAPCRVAATSNITLSGLQTVGGIVLAVEDRVLVMGQTDAADNGIYSVQTSAWVRTPDFDGNRDIVQGTMVAVVNGTGGANLYEVTTANPITIDTTEIEFILRYGANVRYDPTPAEIANAVTIVDDSKIPGHILRYGTNTTPGTTNMTAAAGSWLDVGMQGIELTMADEEVFLSTWTVKSVTSPIRIRGGINSKITGPNITTNLLSLSESVDIDSVEFDTWSAAVYVPDAASAFDHIRITNCRAVNIQYLLYRIRDSDSANVVSRLIIDKNYVDQSAIAASTYSAGVYFLGPYKDAKVTDNTFLEINGSAIHLGDTFYAMQDIMGEAVVSGNVCAGLDGPTTTEAHGVIVYGRYASITDNIISDLTKGNNSDGEGIYIKCRYCNIANNVLFDACDGQGAINVKGVSRGDTSSVQGYASSVIGNKIFFSSGTTTRKGINIEVEDIEVAFNLVEGAEQGIYTGSFELDHVAIRDNIILNSEGDEAILIQNSGVDCRVERNTIDGVQCDNASVATGFGIRVAPHAALNSLRVVGNTVRIGAECNATTDIKGIVLDRNNAINNCDVKDNVVTIVHGSLIEYGIRIEDTAASDNWRISGNDWTQTAANGFTISGDAPTNLEFHGTFDLTTTDATVTTLFIATLPDNSAYTWEFDVLAMQSDGSNRAHYKDLALFYRDGAGAVQQGATANLITPIESNASWAITYGITSNSGRLQVTGAAATTINWKARVKILGIA